MLVYFKNVKYDDVKAVLASEKRAR